MWSRKVLMALIAIRDGQVSVFRWRPLTAAFPLLRPHPDLSSSSPGSSGGASASSSRLRFPVEAVEVEATVVLSALSLRVGPCPGVLPGFRSIQSFIFWSGVNFLYSSLVYARLGILQASNSALVNKPWVLSPPPPPCPPAPRPGAEPRLRERTVATWRARKAVSYTHLTLPTKA